MRIFHLNKLLVSENPDIVSFFSDAFNFLKREIKKHIINGSSDKWKGNHEYTKDGNIFEDINERDYILKDKEWFRHYVK